jgi:hypothetical protein
MTLDEQKVLRLNTATFAAEDNASRDALESWLTDDFQIARGNWTIETKDQMLKRIGSDTSGRKRAVSDESVKVWPDGAVVTSTVTLTEPDGRLVGVFWNTKVCVRQGSDWKCSAWQVVRLP